MSNSNNTNSSNHLNIPEAREASSVGGQDEIERQSRIAVGYTVKVEYIASVTI